MKHNQKHNQKSILTFFLSFELTVFLKSFITIQKQIAAIFPESLNFSIFFSKSNFSHTFSRNIFSSPIFLSKWAVNPPNNRGALQCMYLHRSMSFHRVAGCMLASTWQWPTTKYNGAWPERLVPSPKSAIMVSG